MTAAAQRSFFEPHPGPKPYHEDPDRLRYYQREAFNLANLALQESGRALVVMATGLGKTRFFSTLVKHWKPGRVLVLAHRDELITQTIDVLESLTGEEVGREQGDRVAFRERIVASSMQTASRPKRLEKLVNLGFDLIVIDEAHRTAAPSYQKILNAFPNAKLLGVTATPDRGDEKPLGKFYAQVPFVLDILDGVNAGYLVPLTGHQVELQEIHLENVSKTAGDLNQKQLDEAMLKAIEGVCTETLRHYPGRTGPCFFPGKRSAEYAAARFNALKPHSAAVVTDDTLPVDRARIFRDVRAGKVQYFCNCQIVTEGFDWPGANLVVLGRPTSSRNLYAQMAGRGARVLPGVVDHIFGEAGASDRRAAISASAKPDCVLLDFSGSAGKHSLCSPVDILGGSYSEEEVAEAKKKEKKSGASDLKSALEQARRDVRAAAESVKASKVTSRSSAFNPFSVLGVDLASTSMMDRRFGATPASQAQVDALVRAGFSPADLRGLSKRQASKLFDKLTARRKQSLCTLKQAKLMEKRGVPNAEKVPFTAAGAVIDYIMRGGKDPGEIVRLSCLTQPDRS